MKRMLNVLIVVVLVVSMFSLPVLAESTVFSESSLESAIAGFDLLEQEQVIEQALDCAGAVEIPNPTVYEGDALRASRSGTNAFIAYDTHAVSIDAISNRINADAGNTDIALSFDANANAISQVADGTILLKDESGSFANGIKVTEHTIRNYTVINNGAAPNTYSATLSMPAGYHLGLAINETTGESDGSLNIFDRNGNIAGFIDKATAYDANGEVVPVDTTVNGNTFSYVYHVSAGATAFPVVGVVPFSAQSDWEAYYGAWPTVSRGWVEDYDETGRSLCFYPNGWETQWLSEAEKETRWKALYNYFGADRQWGGTGPNKTMREQWDCHVGIGLIMSITGFEWNIEPNRPTGASLTNFCNP